MRIISYVYLSLLLALVCFPLRGQELELRDSLEAARITAQRRMQRDVGVVLTSPERIRATASPLGEGDALRWVQSLPGVATGADGTSAFYVRGGNGGGNLLTVDGVPVYGYSHLLGLTTVLPSDVIGSARFVKGGFGGAQGNFSSSHVALQTVQPTAGQLKVNATLNNFLAGAGVSTPVGEKCTLVAAGRISPLSLEYLALKGLMQGGLGGLERFRAGVFDLYGKFSWQIDRRNSLSVWALGSRDSYGFLGTDGSNERMGWGNMIGAVQSHHERDWGRLDLSASFDGYRSVQEQRKSFRGQDYDFSLKSILNEVSLSADGRFPLGPHFGLNAGLKARFGFFAPAQAGAGIGHRNSVLLSAWAQGEWKSERLEAAAGARLNRFRSDAAFLIPDFNVSAKWRVASFLAVEGTFDRISQYYHTLEGLPLGWTMDLIVPAAAALPAEELMQGYAGLELSFGRSLLSAGAFIREMDHLVYYRDASNLFSPVQAEWEETVDVGKGDARGIELLYEYNGDAFYARASATVSKATRKEFPSVNEGQPFHAPFDRRVVANASVEWKGISLSFIYQDGNWVNGRGERYVMKSPFGSPLNLEYFSGINNHQMSPIIRLDANYRIQWKRGRVANELNLGVCNLLNHFNPFTLYYDTAEEIWKEMALLPILPNFSWRIEF